MIIGMIIVLLLILLMMVTIMLIITLSCAIQLACDIEQVADGVGHLDLGRGLVHCCSIFLWDLDWKYSARWEPSIWRCRLLSALQRAQMTGLDQFFCMRYFLCIWRAPSKIFVHFFLLWPPQKGRSFHSGCFFQKCCSTTFLAWFFPFTNHATSLHARNAVRTTFLAGHYNSYKHVGRTSTGWYYLIMTSRKSMWSHRDI